MRILVCGGRDYGYNASEEVRIRKTLDAAAQVFGDVTIIEGGAPGADSFAHKWAVENEMEVKTFPADWTKYGKRAGFIRNTQMLNEGMPDLVIAFPGGKGTAMMINLAKQAGVSVRVIS